MNRLVQQAWLLGALVWVAGFASARQAESPVIPWLELPDGPSAKAWAAVGEKLPPARFGEDFPLERLSSGDAWKSSETWTEWSTWLVQGTGTSQAAAAQRAGLALLALEQGRNEDAWRHFEACANSPEWMARLMPRFLPGTPVEQVPGPGGRPGVLPEGVLLEPCIPSIPEFDSGVLLARAATIRDLQVAGARFDMKVTFDSYGVQLDFEWKSGEAASFRVMIPEPDGFEIRVEYVDWMRQTEKRIPHLVELSKETPQLSLFARIRGAQAQWPGLGDGGVPRELEQAGLWLEHGADETELEYLETVAQSATTVLGHPVRLRTKGAEPAGSRAVGIILQVPQPGPERRRKLAWLASTLEHYRLERTRTGK